MPCTAAPLTNSLAEARTARIQHKKPRHMAGRQGGEEVRIHAKYKAEPSDQTMELLVEVEDGITREIVLTNVSIELREKLVPFLLSFEAS